MNFSNKPKPKEPLYPESQHKLFVGNLAWSVTSEVLTEVFQEHGNVVGARVLYDGDSGQSRGYGFICYSTKEEMEHAMEVLNGTVILIKYFTILCSNLLTSKEIPMNLAIHTLNPNDIVLHRVQ